MVAVMIRHDDEFDLSATRNADSFKCEEEEAAFLRVTGFTPEETEMHFTAAYKDAKALLRENGLDFPENK
ncbi:MAG TPA: hypothetical protein VNM40_04200 [Candidatus Paceibacterota bacterium]|nr:hypothetical protein [Candidatus Paceibacterota bacterium]